MMSKDSSVTKKNEIDCSVWVSTEHSFSHAPLQILYSSRFVMMRSQLGVTIHLSDFYLSEVPRQVI